MVPDAFAVLERRREEHLGRLDDAGHPDLARRERGNPGGGRVAHPRGRKVPAKAAPEEHEATDDAAEAGREDRRLVGHVNVRSIRTLAP